MECKNVKYDEMHCIMNTIIIAINILTAVNCEHNRRYSFITEQQLKTIERNENLFWSKRNGIRGRKEQVLFMHHTHAFIKIN